MFNRKFMLTAVFLLGLLAISAVSATDSNETEWVITEEVTIDDLEIAQYDNLSAIRTVEGKTFDSIQDVVDSANGGDVIELSGTYAGNKSEIKVDKKVTFVGKNNAVLDANEQSAIFHVTSEGVVFKNITFINSKGAIYRSSSVDYFTVENSSFINNSKDYYGGGAAIYGGNAVNCKFISNFADYGSAISFGSAKNCEFRDNYASEGGATYYSSVTDCIFINNSGSNGGAQYYGNATNSIYINNTASNDGGAIYYNWDDDDRYVKNCIFMDNFAYYDGGALFNAFVSNSNFTNNSCYYNGGAMDGGSADSCIFINNSALGNDDYGNVASGGAFCGSNVINSLFMNNYARDRGGAVHSAFVTNSTFVNNTCSENGGAINRGNVSNSIFRYNSAKNGGAVYAAPVINSTFTNNFASENGGGVYSDYCVVLNSKFDNNKAINDGGAVYLNGDMSNSTFTNNTANSGGAVFDSGFRNIVNCNFTGNNAKSDGGAICVDDYNILEISNCIFIKNIAAYGGALYRIRAADSNFTDNIANQGNAMYEGSANHCYFKGDANEQTYQTGFHNTIVKANLKLAQSGSYYKDKTLMVTLTNNDTGKGIGSEIINLIFSNGKKVQIKTNSGGIATYNILFDVGSYSAIACVASDLLICENKSLSRISIAKAPIKITPTKLTTIYNSGKYFKIKVVNSKTNKAISGITLSLNVGTGKKSKMYYVTTDKNGVASFSASKLSVGSHKVVIKSTNGNCSGKSVSSTITIKSIYPVLTTYTFKTIFGTDLHGKGILIKDKYTKEPIKGLKVKLKIQTNGKKYKIYTLYTDSKGKCALFTNKYSVGSHKLIITVEITKTYKISVNKKYKSIKKTASYKIKKGEKFKIMQTNAYFDIIYSNGGTKIK